MARRGAEFPYFEEQMDFFMTVWLALIPLLIAVDPAMSVAVFLALGEGRDAGERRRILRDGIVTALVVGVAFMFLGARIFGLLGIEKADFQIGGGLILLTLSLADLVLGDRSQRRKDDFVGVVPIGTPLIAGPAVLTALTVLQKLHGNAATLAAFLLTLAITGAALYFSGAIKRLITTGGLKAVSKIISILLAGFAVHLIRMGVTSFMGQ